MAAIARAIRMVQCRLPALRPLKAALFNAGARYLGFPIEADFRILRRLGPIGLALDIGGNWGQSIAAFQHGARPARILSFEPNPLLAARLAERFRADGSIEIRSLGLSDRRGALDLFVPRYRDYVYDGLASLDEAEARSWLSADKMMGFDPARLSIDRFTVAVEMLDSFGLSPDVVKIDVQGHEEAVVAGGEATFMRARPITIIESPSPALVDRMRGFGLKPYRIAGGRVIADDVRGLNTTFLTDEQRARLRD